jgi:hypothetical protein
MGRALIKKPASHAWLQQISGIVRRAAGCLGYRMAKTQLLQSKTLNKGIEKTNQIVLGDTIVEDLWKQQRLIATLSFDVAHPTSPPIYVE